MSQEKEISTRVEVRVNGQIVCLTPHQVKILTPLTENSKGTDLTDLHDIVWGKNPINLYSADAQVVKLAGILNSLTEDGGEIMIKTKQPDPNSSRRRSVIRYEIREGTEIKLPQEPT